MSEQPPKKPALHNVPAILTGAAALIASLTAVYVNVRGDRNRRRPPLRSHRRRRASSLNRHPCAKHPNPWIASRSPSTASPSNTMARPAPPTGASPWKPTTTHCSPSSRTRLDDTGGRNVAVPKDAAGVLRLEGRPGARIVIKGWRGRLFGLGRAPDATGEGRLSANGAIGAIRVAAAEPEGGAFVFHLSADPAR